MRCLFLPLDGVGVIKGAIHFGILHQDPLYQFVLLVQYALPPAMNMALRIYSSPVFSINVFSWQPSQTSQTGTFFVLVKHRKFVQNLF
ncbi:hypothetical protein KSP40_PGU014291 [Platanthera guangdongensis]|uniref:Uncharacterized protein n=1 Tax=Platanthera guangdongensis TaxID=2320717 RepID=A0ABR2MW62_9ASPA